MVEITSYEKLEKWLKGKPREWAQVIAARAALRVLPYAFRHYITNDWVEKFALALFRANAISWAARNFPAHDMGHAAADAAADAARAGAHTTFHDADAARAAYAAADTSRAADAARAEVRAISRGAFWNNIMADCDWLDKSTDGATVARRLTREPLWLRDAPKDWPDILDKAATRLLTLYPSYQVWIDWYNRRIEGHDEAFAIPGDEDRAQDKAILIRLADATNKDFWINGATHVNTTLQGWIDEARARAAFQSHVANGGSFSFGSEAELAARAEMRDRLEAAEAQIAELRELLNAPKAGHNQAPDEDSVQDQAATHLKQEIDRQTQQIEELTNAMSALRTELAKPVPDMQAVAVDATTLNRWSRIMAALERLTSPQVVEGFEKKLGENAATTLIISVATAVTGFLMWFGNFFYTNWLPLIIG